VNAHRETLATALTKIQSHLGTLSVRGSPEGATVEVNGATVGRVPCSARVQGGDVVVRVSAPGYIPITRTVPVEARQASNQVFTLVRVSGAGAAAPIVTDTGRASTPTNKENAAVTEPLPPPDEKGPSDSDSQDAQSSVWPWVAAGGSLIALSVGTVAALRWSSKASEFNTLKDAQGNPICGADRPNAGGSDCSQLLSDGRTARTFTIGGLAVGAALGVTSAILFLRESPRDSSRALSCAPAFGAPGVFCSGVF
jgi:hypothetical protein